MPRRGENIFKRKDGRWEGRYMRGKDSHGKTRYGYVYARSYKEVKQKLTSKILEEKNCPQYYVTDSNPTFRIIAEQWLKSIVPHIKESTYVKYRNLLNNHILPELGDYTLQEFSESLLEQFIQKKYTCGRLKGTGGLSASTIQNMLVIIHSVINYASADSVMIPNHREKLPCRRKTEIPVSVLSRQNQTCLENYLIHHECPQNTGILICLYMGLRLGEICALKWESIFLEDGFLRVSKTMQRIQNLSSPSSPKTKIIITDPKSDSSIRDIPIPNFLLSLIKKHFPGSSDCYFLTSQSNRFIEPRSYENYYYRILDLNQIPRIKFHALRHTFATRCVESNVDAKSLSEMLGHSKVNITFDRYVHVTIDMKRKNIEKIPVPEIC